MGNVNFYTEYSTFPANSFCNKDGLNYFSAVLLCHGLQQKSWRNSLHQSNKVILKTSVVSHPVNVLPICDETLNFIVFSKFGHCT